MGGSRSGHIGPIDLADLYADWGRRIEAGRKAAGLTQVELSLALGVSQQVVSNWERGIHAPRDEVRPEVARILHKSVYDLFPFPEPNGEAA